VLPGNASSNLWVLDFISLFIGKTLSGTFPVQNYAKQGVGLSSFQQRFRLCRQEYQKNQN
jgi:hypothetical protein